MAEPTCVMHPFSYTSPEFSNENHEENTMYGLGDSVSFGRYMTEDNLSWEKWSSFNSNRNRYVEEAEKYSKPGSVAQKKAYFEAHFKRMAALKAAALLEQAQNMSPENLQDSENLSSNVEYQVNNMNQEDRVEKKGHENKEETRFVVHQNELYSINGGEDEVLGEANNIKEVDVIMEDSLKIPNGVYSVDDVKSGNCSESKEKSSGLVLTQVDKQPSLQQKTSSKLEPKAAVVKRNPPLSSYMSSTTEANGIGRTSSPAKSSGASVYPGKENYATPVKQKSSNNNDTDKKRTPLRMSINRELNKILSPVIKKIGQSSSKASKDCSTPMKTPAKGSMNGVPEAPPLSPSVPKRGSRSHLADSSARDKKTPGPRWHILSSDGFKSPSTGRNKTSSPIIPNSFCMSGERAARRKQKLEEKFNATTTERPPQPSKFKEKAEAELNKFRQSFCFKAMSSPDHCRENEAHKSPNHKSESAQSDSQEQGRHSHTSTAQNRSFLPPRRPAIKLNGSKNVQQKKH